MSHHPHRAGPPAPKTDFFNPGNPAIYRQVAISVVHALAMGMALLGVAHLLGALLSDAPLSPWLPITIVGLVVACLCDVALGVSRDKARTREEARIRRALLAHAFKLGPARFTSTETGRIVSLLTDSPERVTNYRQGYIGQLVGAVLTPFITLLLVAVFVDWLSALVLVVCIPFVPLTLWLFNKLFRRDSSASRAMRARLAGQFLEAIQGLPTLVGLGADGGIGKRLARVGEDNRQTLMRVLARNQLLLFVTEAVFSLFLVCAALSLAWWQLDAGAIDVAGALALVLVTGQLIRPIHQVGGFFYIGMAGRGGMAAMARFLARRTPTTQPAQPDDARIHTRALSFSYGEKPVLSDISFSLNDGHALTLQSTSGSGKTTLLSVLAGNLLPTSGSVSVDGVALGSGTQDEVRSRSAVVNQHTWLFNATLAENLRLANPSASEDEMWSALSAVALDSWARSLPAGLDTHLGERGAGVSGGQAQRISLARALLSGRDLYLLDEPTSQVDLESQAVIEKVIARMAKESTLVLATHRAAVAQGDVYRLDGGRLEKDA
ncbi:ABC transporter ATP-binding protein/permease [Corynebacterium camporealensis]|uniref:ATPase and permease component of ABC-type transporter involved in cytochrome bd biosynthesis n=1 Tax=Corynebacterium camporealensis TaxID=161896 RepID=A0A0F6QYB4_9CORY|nr:ATP-binding cassette domain-containing protein [Corynebacterium camporealensis]AKE40045.1 ATPase and permease component of ABC-type transporter involved in cytochrome bd biosynthesis [Corynebacterium camporealensis]